MRNFFPLLCVLLLLEGVSGDKTIYVTVSVMEGDSVTLNPDGEKQTNDPKLWKFKDSIITDGDRMKLDEPGSLTIKNIRTTDSGLYTLKIDTSSEEIVKKYNVTVSGKKTVSVMEGESIILDTDLNEIQGNYLILWKFEDHLIAEISKSGNKFFPHDTSDERFKGRLQLHRHYGDLTIRGSRSTDSGVYHLNMSSSSYSLQRNIRVTVSSSGRSGAVSGISGASVGLMVWAVTVFLLQEV